MNEVMGVLVFNWQVFVCIVTQIFSLSHVQEVADPVGRFRWLDAARHITSRRPASTPSPLKAYGEDGGEGLDQTTGTKVGRHTIL
jgi:hypothetical protein